MFSSPPTLEEVWKGSRVGFRQQASEEFESVWPADPVAARGGHGQDLDRESFYPNALFCSDPRKGRISTIAVGDIFHDAHSPNFIWEGQEGGCCVLGCVSAGVSLR